MGVRISKATHDALRKRQTEEPIRVSLAALVRHLLDESLGVKRKNGRAKR
jgi:hypothetical protein